ncbi:MAG: hypothetical protein HY831_04870 [Candidatus Aenigmarchaeota archaeon]|nr:hypothetical protein [Candidatus Aenigmarchaeota archaeon]
MYAESQQRPTPNSPNVKSLDDTNTYKIPSEKDGDSTNVQANGRIPSYEEQQLRWSSGLYRRLEDMDYYGSREDNLFSDKIEKVVMAARGNPAPYEMGEQLVHEGHYANGVPFRNNVTVIRRRDAKNRSGEKIGTWYDLATDVFTPLRTGFYPTELGGSVQYPFVVFDENVAGKDRKVSKLEKADFDIQHSLGTLERKDISSQ